MQFSQNVTVRNSFILEMKLWYVSIWFVFVCVDSFVHPIEEQKPILIHNPKHLIILGVLWSTLVRFPLKFWTRAIWMRQLNISIFSYYYKHRSHRPMTIREYVHTDAYSSFWLSYGLMEFILDISLTQWPDHFQIRHTTHAHSLTLSRTQTCIL